jgi:hypothetical protein
VWFTQPGEIYRAFAAVVPPPSGVEQAGARD